MSAFYESIRAEVDQLLADLGRPIKFMRYSYTVDLVQGSSTPTLQAEQVLNSAVVPASNGTLEAFDVRFMSDVQDDTNVRFAIVCAEGSTFVPGPKDRAEFAGKVWQVLGNTPLDVDGTPVIFSVGFRLAS